MKKFYPSVILRHIEGDLVVIEQFRKYFNLDSVGLPCLRIVTNLVRVMIDVRELVTSQGEIRCL